MSAARTDEWPIRGMSSLVVAGIFPCLRLPTVLADILIRHALSRADLPDMDDGVERLSRIKVNQRGLPGHRRDPGEQRRRYAAQVHTVVCETSPVQDRIQGMGRRYELAGLAGCDRRGGAPGARSGVLPEGRDPSQGRSVRDRSAPGGDGQDLRRVVAALRVIWLSRWMKPSNSSISWF